MSCHDSGALVNDHYEVRMADLAFRSGFAATRVVMEVRSRDPRRPAGAALMFGAAAAMRRIATRPAFGTGTIGWLAAEDDLHPATLDFLAGYCFTGHIGGLPEGEVVFADTPILAVEGSFAEVVVLGCTLMASLNVASAIGTAAFEYVDAASGRVLAETALRHLAPGGGDVVTEACYAAGFDTTASLGGARSGVPTIGNCSHAIFLLHEDERDAFRVLHARYGDRVTVLVDTFDTARGIDLAFEEFGADLGAIRIDSGDLHDEVAKARERLDALGCAHTRIVVSGDLTPRDVRSLATAPVDGFVVGSRLAGGLGSSTLSASYKLALVDPGAGGRAVGKRSPLRVDPVGAARAVRRIDIDGKVVGERRETIGQAVQVPSEDRSRPWVQYMRDGTLLDQGDLEAVRERVDRNRGALARNVIGGT